MLVRRTHPTFVRYIDKSREYYAAHGYRGEGDPFPMPDELALQAAQRYIRAYELLTGERFVPGELPAEARMAKNLRAYFDIE